MNNTLLESLWARIDANIGSRITQIVELLTQSKAANQEAAGYKDAAAASAAQAATMRDEVGSYVEELDPDRLQTLIDNKISYIVDGAPGDLDTLREIAEYAQDNRGITDQLNAAIGNKANKSHTHTQDEVTGLTTALNGKANTTHTHSQSQITGLSTALGGKADKAHTHDLATLPGRISNEQAPDVTIIGDGADLNTYETAGVFSQNMNAYAEAGTNYPVGRAGLLEVAQSSGMTYQTYTVYSSGAMYYRGRYLQKWGPWKEVSTKGHTHTTSEVTGLDAALDGKADKSYVDARPAIFTVPDINSASTDNLVPGDVVVDTTTWIFYYLK